MSLPRTTTRLRPSTSAWLKNVPDSGGVLRTSANSGQVPITVALTLRLPFLSWEFVCTTGARAATDSQPASRMASASATVTLCLGPPRTRPPPKPPKEPLTVSRFVPRLAMLCSTPAFTPVPTAVSATTDATPMMMPRVVRTERMTLPLRLRHAMRNTWIGPSPCLAERPCPAREDRATPRTVAAPWCELMPAPPQRMALVRRDQAVANDHRALGVLGHVGLVGHEEDRRAGRVEVGEQRQDLVARGRVQVAGRLVRQQQRGLHGERAGDGRALLLAARHLAGPAVALVGQADELEQLQRPALPLGAGCAGVDERQLDVLEQVEAGQEVEGLEDEADVDVARLGALAFVEAGYVSPAEEVVAARRPVQESENVHERRLAAAARPHEGHVLTLVHGERHALEGLELAAGEAVGLADVTQLE